jgi:hypothetical protein
MLVPVGRTDKAVQESAIQALKSFRKGRALGNLSIREMIDEGRRF